MRLRGQYHHRRHSARMSDKRMRPVLLVFPPSSTRVTSSGVTTASCSSTISRKTSGARAHDRDGRCAKNRQSIIEGRGNVSEYVNLERRMAEREVILLDGAVGTRLQSMGVPMSRLAWAAAALESHPFTVRRMHEQYIAAGVDIITTNTYASARQNLEPLGLGDKVTELNLRAVMLAQDARDKMAKERPVLIAGSVSNVGLRVGCEGDYERRGSETSEAQAQANLRQQAEVLAEAGVDLLLAESTGCNIHRKWVVEACLATGLPVWSGFKVRFDPGEAIPRLGYTSPQTIAEGFDEVVALGGSVVCVFHSLISETDAALNVVQEKWQGPICVYPEAEREDYADTYRDDKEVTPVTPEEYIDWAVGRVEAGVQVVGGCCGIEIEHIRPLRDALPTHLPYLKRGSVGLRGGPRSSAIARAAAVLLVANVFSYHLLVSTHRRDEVPTGPEMLPYEVTPAFPVHPRNVDRTLSLDETDYLGHCILGRDRYHHVYVVRHQVAFLYLTFLLLCQTLEHLSQLAPNMPKQRFPSILRYEHYVILTLPTAVT